MYTSDPTRLKESRSKTAKIFYFLRQLGGMLKRLRTIRGWNAAIEGWCEERERERERCGFLRTSFTLLLLPP
jgi:hypothetical protein